MSDFPHAGNVAQTRKWLDDNEFKGVFMGWKADAIMGLNEEKLLQYVPGENGDRLWALLNTAKQHSSKSQYFFVHNFLFLTNCLIPCIYFSV